MSDGYPNATYDERAQASYVYLSPLPVARTVSVSEGVNVDYSASGWPVGVEFLWPPRRPVESVNTEQAANDE